MTFGSTLRVLRLHSGLGLRDLARRLGVSSTYLSRIENDIDPAPTPARLADIAHELGISATTLIEIARRVSPLLTDYIEQVPEAGSLFVDLALRKLSPTELAQVQAFVDRRFPRRDCEALAPVPSLVELITEERLVLGLRCAHLSDALQIAAGRLAAHTESDAATITAALLAREGQVACGVGGGVAVVCATLPDLPRAAALITLTPALVYPTPDNRPVQVLVVLLGTKGSTFFAPHVAEVARLADRGLADALCKSTDARQVLDALASSSSTSEVTSVPAAT